MSTESTPQNMQLTWWQMTVIKVAGMVCLPVFLVGAEIGKQYGLAQALVAILAGNIALFLLGLFKCKMALQNKNNTMENAVNYFGVSGTKIFSLNIIVSLIGWFAIQLNVIGLSMQKALDILTHGSLVLPVAAYNIIFGLCITFVALFGLKGLNKLATCCAPLLFFTVAFALTKILGMESTVSASAAGPSAASGSLLGHHFTFQGISLVIAAAITAIIDLPTYYRYARSEKDGQWSLFLTFIIALPFLEFVGAYMTCKIPGANFIDTLSGVGGSAWHLWVSFFLIFAGWTINNTNLYSAAVAMEQICWKQDEKKRSIVVGLVGTLVSCFSLLDSFTPVLNTMGIFVSSMGAVIVCNFTLNQLRGKDAKDYGFIHFAINICAWALGAIFGILNMLHVLSLTGIELLDAFIVASIASIVLLLGQSILQQKGVKNEKSTAI